MEASLVDYQTRKDGIEKSAQRFSSAINPPLSQASFLLDVFTKSSKMTVPVVDLDFLLVSDRCPNVSCYFFRI